MTLSYKLERKKCIFEVDAQPPMIKNAKMKKNKNTFLTKNPYAHESSVLDSAYLKPSWPKNAALTINMTQLNVLCFE